MILLPAADRLVSPWKNDLGVTREIAIFPDRTALDGFVWRVSLATVHAAGPFSHFADTDRTLAVLKGRLSLTLAGETHELDPETAPFGFPGDVPVEAQIGSGAVTDLNLMTRRGQAHGVIERVHLTTPTVVDAAPNLLLLAASAGLEVIFPSRSYDLGAFDAIMLGPADRAVRLQPRRATTVYLIRITTVDGDPRR